MVASPEAADVALRALSDRSRRRILSLLGQHPRSVGEVARELGSSQQMASHHLRVLRNAGLVGERHEHTRHVFMVQTEGLAAVRDVLDGFWPVHLAALKSAAEAHARGRSQPGTKDG